MRPLSVVAALLLILGVTLTSLNLLLGGWTVYAAGHVLAIAALVAFWVANRGRLDPWFADPIVRHQDLTVQVAGLDVARVGEKEAAHPGRRQFIGDNAAQSAAA